MNLLVLAGDNRVRNDLAQMNQSPALPFACAYWAASGRLLAGCYPGDLDPEEARRKLQGLIDCGVGRIINLMEVNEVNWNGKPFADYRPPLEVLARGSRPDDSV